MLDVVEHVVGLAEGADFAAAHVRELAMPHGDDDGVEMRASSLTSAMLTSRWVFSITLAASAISEMEADGVLASLFRFYVARAVRAKSVRP